MPPVEDEHRSCRSRVLSRRRFSSSGASWRGASQNPTGDYLAARLPYLTQREFDVYFVLLATAATNDAHTITHACSPPRVPRPARTPEKRPVPLAPRPRNAALGDAVHYFSAPPRKTDAGGDRVPAGPSRDLARCRQPRRRVFREPRTFDVGRDPNSTWRSGPAHTSCLARTSRD